MRALPRLILVGLLGVAAAFLVACGDRSGLIPGSRADRLDSDLDRVQSALADQNCSAASGAVGDLQGHLGQLSSKVDADLRRRLNEGAARLARQVPRDCQATQTTETQTQTETTQTETAPTQTETQTTETQTTPTQTETQTTQTQTTPPATTPGTGGTGAPGGGNSGGGGGE
jgi:hypothetical protein